MCESEERIANNFTNLLQHIEKITLESQKNLNFRCNDGIQTNQRGNPLKYELVPPQYLLKRQGYAVCRHCAVNAHGTNERKSVNLFGHHNEDSMKTKRSKQQTNENEQMERIMGTNEKTDVKNWVDGIDRRQIYLTIELNGCLIKTTHAIIEAIKATKALQFVSGDLYPTLVHDIKLLHEFYERLRTYNSEMRRLKDIREHRHDDNQGILNVGALTFANPLIANEPYTNEANVTVSKQSHIPSKTTQNEIKLYSQETENPSTERNQRGEHFIIRPAKKNSAALEVKRTISTQCSYQTERKENAKHHSRLHLGPLWTKQNYLDYLET